jgi:hypothetical protein
MCSSKTEDTQEICRREQETTEILTLIKRRATGRIHCGYWLTAIGFGATALLAWGLLLAYGLPDEATHMSLRDGTLMTFSVLLGGAAIGSIAVFAVVRHQQRLAAERDQIDTYRHEQQMQEIKRGVASILSQERRRYVQSVINDFRAENPDLDRNQESGTVVPIGRPRQGQSSS